MVSLVGDGTNMNLQVLKKKRHTPKPGDVFAMRLPNMKYLFGRVVNANANPLGVGGAILIYVYQMMLETMEPPSDLSADRLLLPPMMTNRLPWSRGYFAHLENRPLVDSDLLDQHCFKSSSGKYFDEYRNPLPGPTEPVGEFGLHSYRTIDDAISKALGFPLAPD